MKNLIFTHLLLIIFSIAFAQSPESFNYQAILRNTDGEPLINKDVSLKLSILSDTAQSTIQYSELHYTTTDGIGRINLAIGRGNGQTGNFAEINWSASEHFIRIELDEQGGTNFQYAGQTQLLSVPYALYANDAGVTFFAGEGIKISGDTISNTGDLSNTNELQAISISNDTIFLSDGGFVKLPLPTNAIIPVGGCIQSLNPEPPQGYTFSGTSFTAGDQWNPMPSMSYSRFAPAVAIVNNNLYVMGGWDGYSAVSNIVEVYDFATGIWSRKANMHTAVVYAAAAVIGNAIHVMGGYNGSNYVNRHQVYNTDFNSWSLATNLPQARSGCGAAVAAEKIYLIGGYNNGALNTNQMFDPASGNWSNKSPMPTARTDFGIAAMDNSIYVVAGWNDTFLNTNEVYYPATDTWLTIYPSLTYRSGCSVSALNNKIYLIGGGDEYSYQNLTEEYDPLTNIWQIKAYLPSPRSYFGAVAHDNKIYVAGGNFGLALKTMYVYDPATTQFYIHCSQ